MRRIWFITKEMAHLIRTHKLYFISSLLLTLVLLAFLALYLGPTAVLGFFYTGL